MTSAIDPLDMPGGDDEMTLVMPFVVCNATGGPYHDDSFVAGWQGGEIFATLRALSPYATRVQFPLVFKDLLPQLELVGMHFNYPVMETFSESGDDEDSEWVNVVFSRGEDL